MASAVEALRSGDQTMILLGGNLSHRRLEKAAVIAATCGARLARELFPTVLRHGVGVPTIEHMPYPPEAMHAFMANTRHLILLGANPPTTFFAYPGVRSSAVPDNCQIHTLAEHDDVIDDALDELVRRIGGVSAVYKTNEPASVPADEGPALNSASIARILAAHVPKNAIILEEAISSSPPLIAALKNANPHDLLFAAGGSIGWGIPAAAGAAIAAPDRKVICLTGDGSALYSLQGLWTLAREALNAVVVVYANRDYSILKSEFDRVGAQAMGEKARAMMTIHHPTIDFVALAVGLGVPAVRSDSSDSFSRALTLAIATPGPYLIEAVIPGTTG